MKKRIIAFAGVMVVALLLSVLLVNISDSGSNVSSDAFEYIPSDIIGLVYFNNPRNTFKQIQTKTDIIYSSGHNVFSSFFDVLPSAHSKAAFREKELSEETGICFGSPMGIIINDISFSTPIYFMTVHNKSIFHKYLKSYFSIKEEDSGGLVFYVLKPHNSKDATLIGYLDKDTFFVSKKAYYLSKLIKSDASRINEDEHVKSFYKERRNDLAFMFLNTKKIGKHLSSILSIFEPTIKQRMQDGGIASRPDKEDLLSNLGNFVKSFIKFLYSQESICSSVKVDDNGLIIDSISYIGLSDEAEKVFSEKAKDNAVIKYIPKGPSVIFEDNLTYNQDCWFDNALAGTFSVEDNEKGEKKDKYTVFAMYPGAPESEDFYQLVLSNLDEGEKYNQFDNNYKSVNEKFAQIGFYLPVLMKFSKRGERVYKNNNVARYKLDIDENPKGVFTVTRDMNKTSSKKSSKPIIVAESYHFEMTIFDKLSIFAGGDKGKGFLNSALDKIANYENYSILNSRGFEDIYKYKYPNSTINVFVSFASYIQPTFLMSSKDKPEIKEKLLKSFADYRKSWNMISYKLTSEGLKSRIYLNVHDLGQVVKAGAIFESDRDETESKESGEN